ncbi:hypothetical protein [Robinsoniella peoriensis]|uniref:hypothetical protein n=1 Tax=Robinsoniella peoriensis TaxID=180332 RepID=UPI00085C59DC|nr:hypothetical protein [Robinsoniella peoriensis]
MDNRKGKRTGSRTDKRTDKKIYSRRDTAENNRRNKKSDKNEFPRIIAGAFAAIGVCAFLFGGVSDAVMAAELGKTATVSTSYLLKEETAEKKEETAEAKEETAEAKEGTESKGAKKVDAAIEAEEEIQEADAVINGEVQENKYVKGTYKVVSDPLTKDSIPTEKDLKQDAAAETGAKMLWELYGLKMNGATIYMSYNAGTETFPRAFWSGDVRLGDTRSPEDTCYSFMIDAVTGERFNAGFSRTLDKKVSLDFDQKLMDNPGEYTQLAKELAEKLDIVNGKAASSEYGCQGYSNNDPDITIEVTGINGERALLSFSRYDQKFKGVIYDASLKISEPAEKASALKASEKALETLESMPEAEYAEAENSYLIPSAGEE